MMLSKAEVVFRGEGRSYTYCLGANVYKFVKGKKQRVPVAVAVALKSKQDQDGTPLFKANGLPNIVTRSTARNEGQKQLRI